MNDSLRNQLRQARNQLSASTQQQHAMQVAQNFCQSPLFRQSQHIALYLANDGELNPCDILAQAWLAQKKTYLPVLWPHQQHGLWFTQYHQQTQLIKNQYAITEPNINIHPPFSTRQLDLILMPLVGFDLKGNRLGMGGGYYDRTLAFKVDSTLKKPVLIGLAHSCQQYDELLTQDWDITLDGIVTEHGLHFFR